MGSNLNEVYPGSCLTPTSHECLTRPWDTHNLEEILGFEPTSCRPTDLLHNYSLPTNCTTFQRQTLPDATLLTSQTTPVTSQTMPLTSQSMPFTSQTMPVTSQTMPFTSQTMPVTSQTMHFTSQTMPFMSQTMPVTSQTIIVTSQTMPLTSQTTPMTSQTVPLTSQTMSMTSQTMPVTSQTTLLTSQTVPLTSQTMSMTSQAMPVMSQTPMTSQTTLLTSQKVPLTTPTSSMTSQKVPFTSVTTPFTSQVPHMLTLSTPRVSQAVPPRVTTVAPSITSQLVPPHVTRLPRLRTSQSVLDTLPQRTTASASSTPSKSASTPSVTLPSTTLITSDVATCSNTSTNSVTSPSITTQGTSNAATCSKVNALTPTSTRLTLTPPPKEQLQPVKYSTPRASLSTSLVKLSTLPKHLPMSSKLPKKHILPSSTLNPTTLDRTVLSRLSRLLVFWLITSISTVACFPTPTGSNNNNASGPENLSTSSMTIKLSFLDQILNKSTTADTKNADVTSEGDKRQYLSTVLPLNVANLFEGPSTYSSAYDVSHTDTSQLMSTDNETILLDIQPTSAPSNQSVNLAVIPVLGVFFLMVIVWTKCSTWFRDNLRDQDIDDDGKEYVILSPPEEGYREVEFRSDTSSMYYDTVSSYRSILRQKVEYGGFNNYDTVTSIRSILQRPDVCDASVQVRLQGEQLKTERWKSISGILNNSGSSSDLLRVPKKTHRQVSFQTSHNECYDPPLQQMCDANIQVGDSSTERMKIEEKNKEQGRRGSQKSGDITLTGDAFGSKSFGSGTQLSTESSGTSLVELDDLDLAYTSSSQQDDDDDDDDDDELSKDQDTYGTGRGDSASGRSCGGGSGGGGSSGGGGGGGERDEEESVVETSCYSGVTSVTSKEEPAQCEIIRPKHKKGHQFQVLRVDSSDGLYTKPQPPPSHEHETTASETTDLSEKDTTLLTETSQDDLSLAQTLSHPHHYLCRRLRKAYSSKDSASISDSISDFKPPIFREVKFGQPPSDEEESDYIDDLNLPVCRNKRQHSGAGEKLLTEKDNELACWCEQFKGDDLNQLLDAHASAVAGAPKASPISMHSSASSNIVSIHSSCSSLAAIKDEAATEGTADEGGEEQDFPPDDSGYIAEEEAPLITSRRPSHPVRVYPETFPKPSRKMGIRLTGSGVGVGGGGGGVGSGVGVGVGGVGGGGGGGGQDVVVNTVKELREAEVGGDATSCDVTPLTSSNNSLHDSWDVKHTHQQQQQQHHQQQQKQQQHHHHHQQQQQHPPPPPLNQPHQSSRQWRHQSMESVRSPSEEVPHRDERQSPLYIPHEERPRPGYSNNNNNNNNDNDDDDDDSLRRSVIDRKLRGNPPPSTTPSNNNNNNNSNNSNSNSSDNNNSTVGSNSSGGGGSNNNNNNNSEEETKDVAFTGAVATTTLPVDQEEEEGTRETLEPVEFKRFHRRPVVPFQYENEPLLSSAGNQTNPTVTSTAEHQQHPTK